MNMEIIEKYGALSESSTGWKKELRLIDWNKRGPRYDLREWSPCDTKSSKGITLSLKEMIALKNILLNIDLPDEAS